MSPTGTVRIDRPFDELAELLSVRPADWVVAFLRIATHAGEAAAGRSLRLTSRPGSRQLTVDLLPAVPGDDRDELVVPLRWRTAGFHWVPSSYAGRIVVRRVSARACEMLVEGSYALPSTVIDLSDAKAASLATEATMATFLRSFRVAVEERARQTG
ncbi:MAG: hypothetical protein WEB06_09060 [Actinomycetota bacterium]